jgi:hypothetical protein
MHTKQRSPLSKGKALGESTIQSMNQCWQNFGKESQGAWYFTPSEVKGESV